MRTLIQRFAILAALAVAALAPASAAHAARGLGVEVWTDRGNDGVYKPGDRMEVRSRVSDDAYLLVYEIDSEGYVRVLFPERGNSGFVEGRRTLRVPSEYSDVALVVQQPVGEGFIVAVASETPFDDLPWYLRPYDPRAEDIGYEGASDEEEGITGEGRIVGDPFVAMERIRRRLVREYSDLDAFSTSYVSYYVHHRVRYPRYVCYDCHRPGYWNWWSGFDPYYTSCSVFSVRVNWGWYWGPSYWCGYVPYYVYTYRPDCPPHYKPSAGITYSAWNGWAKWNALWGGHLVRYKSEPPKDWSPPSKYRADRGWRNDQGKLPPGFLVADPGQGLRGSRVLPTGRLQNPSERGGLRDTDRGGIDRRPGDRGGVEGRPGDRGGVEGRQSVRGERDDANVRDQRTGRGRLDPAPREDRGAPSRPSVDRPAARPERPTREEAPRQVDRGRTERPAPVERRVDPPREEKREAPRSEPAKPDRTPKDSTRPGKGRG